MKSLKIYFFLMIFVFSSCIKEESPRPVAEKFLDAMQKRDYSEAAKYGTKETEKLLKQLAKIESINDIDEANEKHGKISVVSEEIRGNTAIVYFTEEGNDQQQKITLKKEQNDANTVKKEWKVALKKEEIRLNKQPGLDLKKDSLPAKLPS